MSELSNVTHNGNIYAKFFRANIAVSDGVTFVTEDGDPLQVGIFERKKGYEVAAHRHLPRKLDLQDVGEFLWIQSGSARVTVFDEDWNVIHERNVSAGDCIVFLRGGHGLKVTSDTRILEVKQGPYPGRDAEKVFRNAA